MRLKLLKILIFLYVAGFSDARPQKLDVVVSPRSKIEDADQEGWRPVQNDGNISQEAIDSGKDLPQIVEGNSRIRISNSERDAKNLPDMKQSLRTVTTQLLNVTDLNESTKSTADLNKSESKKLVTVAKIEKMDNSKNSEEKSKTDDKNHLIKEINSEISSLETMGVGFGRPVNSKFGYFETSHPGEAMAMTDEELEKELSSKHDRIGYKNKPTTSGGISTWILLNSPTTTPKSTQKETKKPDTVNKFIPKPTASIEKVKIGQQIDQNPIAIVEKVIPAQFPGKITSNVGKPAINNVRNNPKTTTARPQTAQTPAKRIATKTEQPGADVTTPKIAAMTPVATVEKNSVSTTEKTFVATKKTVQSQRPPQQKLQTTATTIRSTTKTTKVNVNRGKFPGRITTTVKPEIKPEKISTVKVEKVTFKPVEMIATPKVETKIEKPMLVTKVKENPSPIEMPKITTASLPEKSTTPKVKESSTVRTDFTGSDLVEVPVQTKPSITKVSNVLKAQLKRPVNEASKIETESVKVKAQNANNEKATNKEKIDELNDKNVAEALDNSQIDLQFDFNPELTKIEIETATEEPTVTTTTKKPKRNSQKRRKHRNKNRRRRPSSNSTTESNEIPAEPITTDTALQESKIEPETKEGNATKNKKKQVQKPIGTQIYNYLSREIMPSFGVVSLVGLGLGIASYFLYPFGGGISRRNYELEPNYKYNPGEYGGNYGQNEEEVFSKVLQGMTNHESKYGGFKEYDQNNYYRYQKFGSPNFSDTKLTKKNDHRYSSSSSGPTYKPLENTYDIKYRNTEFKYPEVPTTQNYFERQKQSGYTVSSDSDPDRQFVVGNVPKEYNYEESSVVGQKTPTYDNGDVVDGQTQFERNVAQNYAFSKSSVNVPALQPYGQPEALPLKNDDNYEDLEITPAAVAVEHGPRALKVKRSIDAQLFGLSPRLRRESVIQVIPPSGSQEIEEKEENLSNEILNILDLVIPGKDDARKIKDDKISNAIDDDEKTEKKRDEKKPIFHENTTKKIVETEEEEAKTSSKLTITTPKTLDTSSVAPSSSSTEAQEVQTISTTQTSAVEEATTIPEPKDDLTDENATETEGQDLEETTLEWIDVTTSEKPGKEEKPGFDLFGFVRNVAEIKFRLGLTILKHASEGFARYLGGIQKRINGEE